MVRAEIPEDIESVDAVTRAAFGGYPGAGGPEVALLHALRAQGALRLSLVMPEGPDVVGHAAFSPVEIDGASGWFGLGPVSVKPDRQGKGIGSRLIQTGLDHLRTAGVGGCVVLGEAAYYRRFGFQFDGALTYPPAPPEHFGGLSLVGPAPRGVVRYHPAFDSV